MDAEKPPEWLERWCPQAGAAHFQIRVKERYKIMQKVVGRLVGNRFGPARVQVIGLQTGGLAPERADPGVPSPNPSIDSERRRSAANPARLS